MIHGASFFFYHTNSLLEYEVRELVPGIPLELDLNHW